ncbi:MAG: TonB-dependent receptor plug domain-containing protein [Gracilimonas sp.]|uniref:TonB-dependent receptor n=1 Tax=Gracilimonas sp. TaxID=1974203 RepID=UPI0019B1EEB0|nr:TonB-dependent receptor plug domain-containing protein [Gracilimonas sp.]MBD3617560.1 TonB-dependent receptor plug domain-containing protein [Gracilimonas sp.]
MSIQKSYTFLKTGLLSISLLLIFFTSACTSTANVNDKNGTNVTEQSAENGNDYENLDLTNRLRRMSGVTVRGSGENAFIAVRGREGGSLSSNRTPLFVINGQAINSSYSQIYHMVHSFDIKSVQVLTSAEAARYGNQALNGVIVITTK